MSKLVEYIPFVKEQIAFQKKMADKYTAEAWRQDLHLKSAHKFEELMEDINKNATYVKNLEKLEENYPSPKRNKNNINLSFGEIQDLPEELLQELSISDTELTEFAIYSIIEENGGVASLDRILTDLYKKTGEIHKRPSMTAKLYRMTQKEMVFGVPNKKGIYTIHKDSEEDNKLSTTADIIEFTQNKM